MERLVARRIVAEKYRLERALAAGGMGSVWSAWNTQLDVPVAIKFMAPAMAGSADLVARFEREARAAAQIRSSHVVQIFEHGVDCGLPYIVMELLEGEDLGQRMRRVGRMTLLETARVLTDVCKALRRAHAMGIVHRDLKPANVFLAAGDEEDEEIVKVLDFGVVKSLAEAVDSGVTKTGELVGTPHYMSPEQARCTKTVDHRSDLWSLGIIAYRALTATLPFPDDSGIERLMRICTEPVPPPSTYAPDLDLETDAFFARALARDPDDRFQSAREMADALGAVAGIPISSPGGPRSRRPTQSDSGPLSLGAYTAQAYVYTSAADLEDDLDPSQPLHVAARRLSRAPAAPASRRGDPGLAPGDRASPSAPTGPVRRPSFPSLRALVAPPPPGEQPTRVSRVDPPRSSPAASRGASVAADPGSYRAAGPGSRRAAAEPPDAHPALAAELSTLSSAGSVVGSPRAPHRRLSPRLVLAALLAAAALGATVELARRVRTRTDAAHASPASTAALAAPPAASSTAAPIAAAGAGALPTVAPSAAASTTPPAPSPRRPLFGKKPAPPAASSTAGPRPTPSRTEGGIGRRPTY